MKPFKYYLDTGLARRGSKDIGTARSMINRASRRLQFARSQNVGQDNASFVFEEIYEAMRECAHGMMAADGYKPDNSHEAIVSFIDEFYRNDFGEKLIRTLDRYRIMRNDSIYRLDNVSEEETIKALVIADQFLKVTRELLNLRSSNI